MSSTRFMEIRVPFEWSYSLFRVRYNVIYSSNLISVHYMRVINKLWNVTFCFCLVREQVKKHVC